MSVAYAYLVVEQRTYVIKPQERPADAAAPTMVVDPSASLSDRLHVTLAALAAQPGYEADRAQMRPTPGRQEHVDSLVYNGLLSPADAQRWLGDRVPDGAWAVLRQVEAGAGPSQFVEGADVVARCDRGPAPKSRKVYSWSIELRDGSSPREFPVDPDRCPSARLPLELIAAALDQAAIEGWAIVHASEDRGVDDAASASFVVRQRYLLSRRA